MFCRINHLLTAVICAFIGAFVCHSLHLIVDYQVRPHLYALQSAPWYTTIIVNGLLTILIAGVIWLVRRSLKRLLKQP